MNKRNLVLITGANKIGQSGFPSTSLPPELHIRGYFSMQNHNNYHNHHNNNKRPIYFYCHLPETLANFVLATLIEQNLSPKILSD